MDEGAVRVSAAIERSVHAGEKKDPDSVSGPKEYNYNARVASHELLLWMGAV